jgi:hypothetical protein
MRSTTGHGNPAWLPRASVIMASAITEPTERSMPAVRITRNMPSDKSAFIAICFRMFIRLGTVRK